MTSGKFQPQSAAPSGLLWGDMKPTSDELHAFLIGFFEALCPWEARYISWGTSPSPLKGEEHYYLAGRALGFIALIWVILGIAYFVKEVLI